MVPPEMALAGIVGNGTHKTNLIGGPGNAVALHKLRFTSYPGTDVARLTWIRYLLKIESILGL